MEKTIQSIVEATTSYEAWLAKLIEIVAADLASKHQLMADDKAKFFRATFYRRTQVLPLLCPQLVAAPLVLSMADAHSDQFAVWLNVNDVENFGGNDFDEAFPLPYPNDLVQLATSLLIQKEKGNLILQVEEACASLLNGYNRCLQDGPQPIILQQNDALRKIVEAQIIESEKYWEKLLQSPDFKAAGKLVELLRSELPAAVTNYRILARSAGKGSLGRQRIDMIAPLADSYVAEEAKALAPSACVWATGKNAPAGQQVYEEQILLLPTRSPDPSIKLKDGWLLRKLSPASRRIELAKISDKDDQDVWLRAMGFDLGNIHLGTPDARESILHDFQQRESEWLLRAAQTMLEQVDRDWDDWKQHWSEQAKSR